MGWFLQRLKSDMETFTEKQSLDNNEIKIGRAKESDVLCVSVTVSRHHAKITFRNDIPYVMDLKSANGTFVNAKRIHPEKECRLVTGDVIGLGFARPDGNPGSFVYRILREAESDERSSSRTSFNSCLSRSSSPQHPAANSARAGCSTSSKSGVKRSVVEIIDLSDEEDRKPLLKKTKTELKSGDSSSGTMKPPQNSVSSNEPRTDKKSSCLVTDSSKNTEAPNGDIRSPGGEYSSPSSKLREKKPESVSIDLPLRRPSQSVNISIDDVFFMHQRTEDEKSTILNTSDGSDASRSKSSKLAKSIDNSSLSLRRVSKDSSRQKERISKCRNSCHNVDKNFKSLEFSDFGRSLDDPSSDSSRLVIDEDMSCRPSTSRNVAELNTPIGNLQNKRVASLIRGKAVCATSTPHTKREISSSDDTPFKSFAATMSPIPLRADSSPLMSVEKEKEPVINKGRNDTYTLDEEDVIVVSDEGEDFPNSQLFDDRPGRSKGGVDSDEEHDVKPLPEEDEKVEEAGSPFLEDVDIDSDSDAIVEVWMSKLSQSQSFIKAEPEEEPEPEPEPEDFPVLESEKSLEVSEPEVSHEPEDSDAQGILTSVHSDNSRDSKRDSVDTSDADAAAVQAAPAAVMPASRVGYGRLASGPEVIDAPPMPKRRAHLRGISVLTANFLQDNRRNKPRSVSADRSGKKEKALKRNETSEKMVSTKSSAKEERKARLREITEKKRADTSVEQAARSDNKKGTAKVKVTEKLRGDFLTEMTDSMDSGKRSKVPSRQSVLQMKQIPKLKIGESSTSRSGSPLEDLNLSFERYKRPSKPSAVPAADFRPIDAVPKPMAQVAPRVAHVPHPADTVQSRAVPSLSTHPPARALRSCLKDPSRRAAVYMQGLPKKRVVFTDIVNVRQIEALPSTRPANQAKDAPMPAYTLIRHSRAPAPDLSVDGVLKDIFQWKTKWLEEYLRFKDTNPQNMPNDPPAQGVRPLSVLPREFVSYDEYFDKMYPLLLVELWNGVVKEWEMLRERHNPVTHYVAIDHVTEDPAIVRVTCHALYTTDCPKLGDLVVCEFAATSTLNTSGKSTSTSVVMDGFGFVCSENRERLVRNVNEMLLVKNPSARRVVQLTVQMKNRNVKYATDKLMRMKVVKYIRPDLRYFQALKHLKTLTICPSILSPKADSSAFELPPAVPMNGQSVNMCLNPSQQEAIVRITRASFMTEPKICVIQGPPGTGKSHLIASLVLQLLYSVVDYDRKNRNRGKIPRILLCAPSNAAVDVLVLRLLEERKKLLREQRFKMVRVGRLETMHPLVRDISLETLAKKDVFNQVNMDTSSLETELRMYEARLRASEHAFEASKRSRQRHGDSTQEEAIRELKRKMAVLQSRVEQSNNADPHRNSANPGAEREASKRLLKGADIVATTLSSCFTKTMENVFPLCSNGEYNFTCCIIDEATQCMEVQTLTPFMLGVKTLVLVGDTKQLQATVLSQNARNCGLGTSLFGRILPSLPQSVHFLDTQYRMHPEIVSWPNKYFYNDRLRSPDCILDGRICPLVPYSVLRTPFRQDSGRGEVNTDEAKFVLSLAVVVVQKLLEELTAEYNLSVGIITPYQRQKQLLLRLLHERYPQNQKLRETIDINTFDSFQGQEKDVIIMSCVRTDKIGFLNDPQRLNVALTRAKFSLLICGNFAALYGDEMWNNLLQDAQNRRRIKDVRRSLDERELWAMVSNQQ